MPPSVERLQCIDGLWAFAGSVAWPATVSRPLALALRLVALNFSLLSRNVSDSFWLSA
jgi:hypothetical protein